jgi:uncharacterized protein YxjI
MTYGSTLLRASFSVMPAYLTGFCFIDFSDRFQRTVVIKKALIAPFRDRWDMKIKNGPDLDVQGNILDHEYTIKQGRDKVAGISKKWFRLTDTYGVEIDEGQNDILILAVAVAIDMMAHPDRKKKEKDKKEE